MLDFGLTEFVLVASVAVFAIGPKQIPEVLYQIGRFVRRLQGVRHDMQGKFDEFMHEADIEELQRETQKRVQDMYPMTPEQAAEVNRAVTENRKIPPLKSDALEE